MASPAGKTNAASAHHASGSNTTTTNSKSRISEQTSGKRKTGSTKENGAASSAASPNNTKKHKGGAQLDILSLIQLTPSASTTVQHQKINQASKLDGLSIFQKRRPWSLLPEDDIVPVGEDEEKTQQPSTNHEKKHGDRKKKTIILRTEVQSQPRPSPPFVGLAKVVDGPHTGMTGYLSPTGTYGYSVLSTRSRLVTVKDSHVVEAKNYPAEDGKREKVQQPQPDAAGKTNDTSNADKPAEKDTEDSSIRNIFLKRMNHNVAAAASGGGEHQKTKDDSSEQVGKG